MIDISVVGFQVNLITLVPVTSCGMHWSSSCSTGGIAVASPCFCFVMRIRAFSNFREILYMCVAQHSVEHETNQTISMCLDVVQTTGVYF